MKFRVLISCLAAGTMLAHATQAQDGPERRRRHYNSQARAYYRGPVRFTLGGGVGLYSGDLGSVSENLPGPSVSVGLLYLVRPRLVVDGEASYFQLGAKDHLAERGLAFRGRNVSGTTFLRFELVRDEGEFATPKRPVALIKPYLKAGAGFLLYNPQAYRGTARPASNTGFLPPERNDYAALALTAPVGVGLVFRLSPKLNATLEGTYSFTTTDQLDDISPASGRSTSKLNDGYGQAELKLEYAPWAR